MILSHCAVFHHYFMLLIVYKNSKMINVVMSMSNLATNSFHDAYYTSSHQAMQTNAPTPINQSAAMLVADDFAERTVVTCMSILREAGIKVELIGATPHPVRGRYGISIVPDLSLSQLETTMLPGLVVIPGELGCIQALARDPRATRFVYRLTVNGGFLAFAPQNEADAMWPGRSAFRDEQVILRGNRPISQFAYLLRDVVKAIP